jgi:hypothetical protein
MSDTASHFLRRFNRFIQAMDLHKLLQCYREWSFELAPKLNFLYVVRRLGALGSSKRMRVLPSIRRCN